MVKVNILDPKRTELTQREKDIIEQMIRAAQPREKEFMLKILQDEKQKNRF